MTTTVLRQAHALSSIIVAAGNASDRASWTLPLVNEYDGGSAVGECEVESAPAMVLRCDESLFRVEHDTIVSHRVPVQDSVVDVRPAPSTADLLEPGKESSPEPMNISDSVASIRRALVRAGISWRRSPMDVVPFTAFASLHEVERRKYAIGLMRDFADAVAHIDGRQRVRCDAWFDWGTKGDRLANRVHYAIGVASHYVDLMCAAAVAPVPSIGGGSDGDMVDRCTRCYKARPAWDHCCRGKGAEWKPTTALVLLCIFVAACDQLCDSVSTVHRPAPIVVGFTECSYDVNTIRSCQRFVEPRLARALYTSRTTNGIELTVAFDSF